MKNVTNISPGCKLSFQGFKGQKPAQAVFSIERYSNGVFVVAGLVGVPLAGRPRSEEAERRAKRWARRRLLRALEAA